MDVDDVSPDETLVGPTADDTVVVPTSTPTERALEQAAWSTEQSPAEDWPQRRAWPLVASIAGGIVFIGVMVAIFIAGVTRINTPSRTAPTVAAPTTTVTVTTRLSMPASSPTPIPELSADDRYILALEQAGIQVHSRENAITTGRTACQLLGQGQSYAQVAARIIANNPTFSEKISEAVVAAAAGAYCPNLAR